MPIPSVWMIAGLLWLSLMSGSNADPVINPLIKYTITDIGIFPKYQKEPGTVGRAVNDSGQVIGESSDDYDANSSGGVSMGEHERSALFSQNGAFTDLSTQIPAGSGWKLEGADAINDRGQIAGIGEHDGLEQAFLMTPIK